MRVFELMSKQVESITPQHNTRQASKKMRDMNIGSLPVLNDEKLVGIVTDRDLVCFVVANGSDPSSIPISNIMKRDVATCYEDDDIADAAKVMQQHHIRRLAVVDHDNRITGLFSIDDLARGSHKLAGIVLEAAEAIH
ncbi:MAG: CBS domain-containing protein [Gammaproteobacteria bacterium]|nr:CBS domain-containing protein [Gammaproteobacteria bacterium]